MKELTLYREDNGQYSTSEAQQDDVSGVYVQKEHLTNLQKQNDELRTKLADIQSKWESATGDISTLFEIQPMNKDDGSYQVDGQCLNSLMKSIEIDNPAQSLSDIRAEAVIEAADKVIRHNEHSFCIHCSLIDHANRIKEG